MTDRLASFRGQAVLAAYRGGETLAKVIPDTALHRLGDVAGTALARRSSDRRRIVERHHRRISGIDLDPAELKMLVEESYRAYTRYYLQAFRLPTMSTQEIADGFTVEGIEHLDDAMANDEVGPILALPHLGGFEWAATWITRVRNWRLAAVVERLEPPEVFEWFRDYRASIGINVIPLGPTAADEVVAATLNREVMCLLCDRDLVGGGPEVEFFGERTTLPAGPAVMALRGGCRVLPTAVYFDGDGVHGVIRPPITIEPDPDATSIRGDVVRFTQQLAIELESLIRAAPEQWLVMQPNWPSDREALGLPRNSPPAFPSAIS